MRSVRTILSLSKTARHNRRRGSTHRRRAVESFGERATLIDEFEGSLPAVGDSTSDVLQKMGAEREIYWIRKTHVNLLLKDPELTDHDWSSTLQRQSQSLFSRHCGLVYSARYTWLDRLYDRISDPGKNDSSECLVRIIKILESAEYSDRSCLAELKSNKDCFILTLEQSNEVIALANRISITDVLKFMTADLNVSASRMFEKSVSDLVFGLSLTPALFDKHLVSSVYW